MNPLNRPSATGSAQADLDEGRRDDGLTSDERDELRRLRRETASCLLSVTYWQICGHAAHADVNAARNLAFLETVGAYGLGILKDRNQRAEKQICC